MHKESAAKEAASQKKTVHPTNLQTGVHSGLPTTTQLNAVDPRLDPQAQRTNLAAISQVVGNRAVRDMLSPGDSPAVIQRVEGGRWDIGPRDTRTPEQIAADEAAGAARTQGDIDTFGGHTLTPDSAQLERVLKSVIATRGFKGAASFVMDYGFGTRATAVETRLRNRILPLLRSKLSELETAATTYAETEFLPAARQELKRMLADSEKMVITEATRYGLHLTAGGELALTETQSLAGLAAAARAILEKFTGLEALNKKRAQYEEKVPITEDVESGMRLSRRTVGYQTRITDPAAHQKITEEILTFQKDYLVLRQGYESQYPILASFRPPDGLSKLKDLAGGNKEDRNQAVMEDIVEKYKNIQKIKEVADDPAFIWQQEMVVGATKRVLGVQPGSVQDKAIDAKAAAVAHSSALKKLGLALMGLVGALILAIPSGGSSLVAWGTTMVGGGLAVAAGGMTIYEGIQEYSLQKAATGTAFDKAQAISQNEPSLFWLAVDIIGAIADLGQAALAFTKAARAIRAMEKTAEIDKAARAAYRESGLSTVMSEDAFVLKIKQMMKANPEAISATAQARSSLMTALAEGKYPELTALSAGSEPALVNLVKAHGRWEILIADLKKGNETMQNIAVKLETYRQKEIVKKIEDMFKARISRGASTEPISDVDFSLATDELGGAGEKLMQAEAYMTNKFGKGWEEMWRVNFYTDMESRLLLTEKALPRTEAARAQLLIKQHTLSNKFNLARQLQSAGSDPVLIARVEKEAKDLGLSLDEIRKLAAGGENAARIRRNELLLKIDELEGAYRAAQGDRRVELAQRIQELQMEANFYSKEAVVSPAAALGLTREGATQGIQIADAITEWKTMLQHTVAEAGGAGKALENYEAWKYIQRQVNAALKRELDPAIKSRLELLRDRAERIYTSSKTAWGKEYGREWGKEAGHLGGRAALEQKNVELYNDFINQMSEMSKEIRTEEMKKLQAAAGSS